MALTPPPPPTGAPSRLAIMLSALVYPGVGQLVQKRWVSGALNLAAFTATGVYFAWQVARIMIAYFSQAFFDEPARPSPGIVRLLVAFGLALLSYAVSLVDTCLAHARATRRFHAERLRSLQA